LAPRDAEWVRRVQQQFTMFKADPSSLEDVKKFVAFYFISARRNMKKPLYHHFTVAVDTNNIRLIFQVVILLSSDFPF
jgi:hypothetical protein